MLNSTLLKYRLLALAGLLIALEGVVQVKLAVAFSWTNDAAFGILAALTLGAFLVGSILALSFDLDRSEKTRLQWLVVLLFVVQTALVCIVSFLHARVLMPAADIAELFNTPVEATRKVVALAEGAVPNLAAFGFWGVLGSQWKKEIEKRAAHGEQYMKVDAQVPSDGSKPHARP